MSHRNNKRTLRSCFEPDTIGTKRSWRAPEQRFVYPALALDRTNDWKPPYAIRSASKPEFEEFIRSAILGSDATFSFAKSRNSDLKTDRCMVAFRHTAVISRYHGASWAFMIRSITIELALLFARLPLIIGSIPRLWHAGKVIWTLEPASSGLQRRRPHCSSHKTSAC